MHEAIDVGGARGIRRPRIPASAMFRAIPERHGFLQEHIADLGDDPRHRGAESRVGRRECRARQPAYVDRFVLRCPTDINSSSTKNRQRQAGHKQLLTIARAFIADPAIRILDEATSSVDTRTEVLIRKR